MRLRVWAARRHGPDTLPLTVSRRRIYILPTRFGLALALLLAAMLIAGLNYNSNLGLAFGFLISSMALVAMHHCHRNLLGLKIDVNREADAMAGANVCFDFIVHNSTQLNRCDIEIRCETADAVGSVPARGYRRISVELPTAHRGIKIFPQFELRTRYPLGWFRAWTYVQRPLTAFIAPQAHGERPLPPAVAGTDGSAWADARGDDDFAGLRAYEAGMPLKHMAWKVLARGNDPAVRSYSGSAAEPEWLDWTTLGALGTEARLSQLCTWVLASETAQRSYGLRLPDVEIQPSRGAAHRAACLRALAAFPDGTVAPASRSARAPIR